MLSVSVMSGEGFHLSVDDDRRHPRLQSKAVLKGEVERTLNLGRTS